MSSLKDNTQADKVISYYNRVSRRDVNISNGNVLRQLNIIYSAGVWRRAVSRRLRRVRRPDVPLNADDPADRRRPLPARRLSAAPTALTALRRRARRTQHRHVAAARTSGRRVHDGPRRPRRRSASGTVVLRRRVARRRRARRLRRADVRRPVLRAADRQRRPLLANLLPTETAPVARPSYRLPPVGFGVD